MGNSTITFAVRGCGTPHPNPLLKEERELKEKMSSPISSPFSKQRILYSISSPFSRERIKVRVKLIKD